MISQYFYTMRGVSTDIQQSVANDNSNAPRSKSFTEDFTPEHRLLVQEKALGAGIVKSPIQFDQVLATLHDTPLRVMLLNHDNGILSALSAVEDLKSLWQQALATGVDEEFWQGEDAAESLKLLARNAIQWHGLAERTIHETLMRLHHHIHPVDAMSAGISWTWSGSADQFRHVLAPLIEHVEMPDDCTEIDTEQAAEVVSLIHPQRLSQHPASSNAAYNPAVHTLHAVDAEGLLEIEDGYTINEIEGMPSDQSLQIIQAHQRYGLGQILQQIDHASCAIPYLIDCLEQISTNDQYSSLLREREQQRIFRTIGVLDALHNQVLMCNQATSLQLIQRANENQSLWADLGITDINQGTLSDLVMRLDQARQAFQIHDIGLHIQQ